jgi:hypothetical protein
VRNDKKKEIIMAVVERPYDVKKVERATDDIIFLITTSATFAVLEKFITCKIADIPRTKANVKEYDGKIISAQIIGQAIDLFELFFENRIGVVKLPAYKKVKPFQYNCDPKKANRHK